MYDNFHLVLMVNHACNLRCHYCYTGAKSNRPMSRAVAVAALDRALASLAPGGLLELGFFGGEPLLEAPLVADVIQRASDETRAAGLRLRVNLTTNGTLADPVAWQVMLLPGLGLHISHDGLPEIHDRHRRGPDGRGSSASVLDTIGRLLASGREPRVVMVVRPDTVADFPDGIAWLRRQGISHVDPSLDIWATWTADDARRLETAVAQAADVWFAGLPDSSVGWFDEKAARLFEIAAEPTARCGYGNGQIAVAPSGNLYPCERVINSDAADNPARLPGHAFDAGSFRPQPLIATGAEECSHCAIHNQCATSCRCSNFIRTGDPSRPDALLCLLDRVCFRETARVLGAMRPACEPSLVSLGARP
ncbi:MAG: radical SAM protein [Planctomycetes bacterium]|nr:radical SAM protein [Planctomycetota bacterium]